MDRIYRLSIPGLFYFSSLIFFLHTFKNFNVFKTLSLGSNVYGLLAIFLTSPFIGFISFTIFNTIADWILHYKLLLPNEIEDSMVEHIWPELDKTTKNDIRDRKRRALQGFYIRYQSFLRKELNSETIQWVARRWTTYFVHKNNIVSIAMALLTVLILPLEWDVRNGRLEFFVAALIFLVYTPCAIGLSKTARKEAIYVEYLAVKHSVEEKEKK
jgi:hypothetical protein